MPNVAIEISENTSGIKKEIKKEDKFILKSRLLVRTNTGEKSLSTSQEKQLS